VPPTHPWRRARDAAATDWAGIERLYATLEVMNPSPVIRLNRAVAVMKARGPEEALAMIEPLAEALDANARTQWGTARACAANLVHGVTTGYSKTLELVGVGYRAQMQGKDLKLALGYSHEVIFKAPPGITLASSKPTEIVITGADKQAVGQAAAEIKKFRPPEPYKGKGIRLQGEYVRRKEGKKK
jgi:large subunit ribosomal protein L6